MERKTHIVLIKPNKSSNACYAITSMYSFSNMTKLTIIYFAYFHSLMEYETIFWANTSDSMAGFSCKRKLQELCMTGSKLRDSGKPLFQKIMNTDFYHPNTYYPWWLFWFIIWSISFLTLPFTVSIQERNHRYRNYYQTLHLIRREFIMQV